MSALTSPDNLPYPLASEPAAPINEDIEDLAVATQLALSFRQRQSFVWVDDDARNAQAGMVQGAEGYVLSTKTQWLYDGGQWLLSLAHAEFTAIRTAATANSNLYNLGVFSLDAPNSTSTSMAIAGADGIIRIANPGLYSISTVTFFRNTANTAYVAATGRAFLDLAFVAAEADIQRVSINVGEDRGSISAGNVRVLAADTPIYFQAFRTVGDTTAHTRTRVRITRIG
ncbi:hypothetical protein IFU30_11035 [Plantibacter sp. CFBP 8798]|uniref:hypothetical protein n=1 Tax=Plantibacter sp. CFBP 8798 TaxID=2775268 RepID=UPI0017876B43|nr:hypothetical protein [Plantibacter sp. CFBP 8798]MBD8466802.1 hypothetical protein [Plantibacter sp. CFBP 8798]